MAGQPHVANNVAPHCEQRSPLIRPNGHLLPRGGEGTIHAVVFHGKRVVVNLKFRTWFCPVRTEDS